MYIAHQFSSTFLHRFTGYLIAVDSLVNPVLLVSDSLAAVSSICEDTSATVMSLTWEPAASSPLKCGRASFSSLAK